MFEFAELAHGVTKIAYRREAPKLRAKAMGRLRSGGMRTLVEANNKYYARIKVLKTLCDALEKTR